MSRSLQALTKVYEAMGGFSNPIYTDEGTFYYDYWVDYGGEGDADKIVHNLYDPKGKRLEFDWTPYRTPTEKDIQLWLKLGRPYINACTRDELMAYARGLEINKGLDGLEADV